MLKLVHFKDSILYVILSESSIHGCRHIVMSGIHILERLFWILVITLSIYFVTLISLDQWKRYQNNPTVFSIQTNYKNWKYDASATTFCSNYTNDAEAALLIRDIWNIKEDHPKYNYYNNFVAVVATTKYNNLNRYKAYINDTTLHNVDLLQIAKEIKLSVLPPNHNFKYVLTELGICFSQTILHQYQSPYKAYLKTKKLLNSAKGKTCSYLDDCSDCVTPDETDKTDVRMFFHNYNDVISISHEPAIDLYDIFQFKIVLSTRIVKASDTLREIDPKRRHCYFYSESVLEYFDVYTENLCQIECHIKKALKLCGCRPFFYNIEKAGPVCGTSGMYCLFRKNWSITNCTCLHLCETNMFLIRHVENVVTFNTDRIIQTNTNLPKTRIFREILFSFEDLIVSFGGAVSLFLGFSFISGIEIIFILIEYIIKKFI